MPTISNSRLRNLEAMTLAIFCIIVNASAGSAFISDNKGSRSMASTLTLDEAVTVAVSL